MLEWAGATCMGSERRGGYGGGWQSLYHDLWSDGGSPGLPADIDWHFLLAPALAGLLGAEGETLSLSPLPEDDDPALSRAFIVNNILVCFIQ